MADSNRYVFINSATGNIIGFLTLPADLDEAERNQRLAHERIKVAVNHRIFIGSVYWEKR